MEVYISMKLSKTLTGAIIAASALTLGACGNHAAKKASDSTPKTEKTSKLAKQSSSLKSSSIESSTISSSNQSSASSSSQATSSLSSSSSSAVSAQKLTPQQVGVLLEMKLQPQMLSYKDDNGKLHLWYGVDNTQGDASQGFNILTPHGDGTATLYYQVQGDNVIVKQMDPNSGTCVADEKLKTTTIPLAQLTQNYSTPQQQATVNNYVNELQDNNSSSDE